MLNVKKAEKESAERLAKLQALRRKAGHDRKDRYTCRIEEEVFGLKR